MHLQVIFQSAQLSARLLTERVCDATLRPLLVAEAPIGDDRRLAAQGGSSSSRSRATGAAELQILALESPAMRSETTEVRGLIEAQTPELRRLADAVISAHLSASSDDVARRLEWATRLLLEDARSLESAAARHDADKAHQLCYFAVELYRIAQGRFVVDSTSAPMRRALAFARDALEFHENNWVEARFSSATRH